MDFIRDMVTCKGQVNEMTDSDSENEHNELQQYSDYNYENEGNFVEPSNATATMVSSAASFVPNSSTFQPIMLSKQWQQTRNQLELSQPQPNRSQPTHTITHDMPTNHSMPELAKRLCDSSKTFTPEMPSPMELMELLAKREQESDLEIESECGPTNRKSQSHPQSQQFVPLAPPPVSQSHQFMPLPQPQHFVREFQQETLVSTSNVQRSGSHTESPCSSVNLEKNKQSNDLPINAMELMEMLAKREPQNDSDLEIEGEPMTSTQSNRMRPPHFPQESQVSTSSVKRSNSITIEDGSNESSRTASTTAKRKKSTESADVEAKDEDYYFVMSLLPSIRQIPRNRKFALRIGIMNLIAKDLEEVCK